MTNSHEGGFVVGAVRTVLRLEGLTVLTLALAAYATSHVSWWEFAALFLAPDLSFLGYLVNPRVGGLTYNTLHSYIAPLLLGLAANLAGAPFLVPLAVIWIAHIGFDRSLGYGLKYASAFGDTHLGSLRRPEK